MTSSRLTVADLRSLKGTRQLTDVYVDSLDEAVAAAEAGIDILTVQDTLMASPEGAAIRDAADSAFIVVGIEYGVSAVTTDDYLRAGFDALNRGADAVWSAASLATIARMRDEGIPVIGHVGLIPARRTWTGGFRAVGKTATSASEVWEATKALEQAGAFAAEIEVVPATCPATPRHATPRQTVRRGSRRASEGPAATRRGLHRLWQRGARRHLSRRVPAGTHRRCRVGSVPGHTRLSKPVDEP